MDFSLSHLWSSMGIFAKLIVITMGIMSVASLLVMFERIVVYMRSGSESVAFAEKMAKVLSGGDVPAAAAAGLTKNVGHLGRTINAGLTAFRTAPTDKDVAIESVARAMERQAAREVQNFKRGLGVLATVGSTAPFIGLLGTTMGIVNAFQQMAATGSGGLGTISGGISEALITTAFGLLVAIPAVMAFNFLQGWVDARSVDLSESSNEFLDVVTRHFAK
ncbi:MAG: MotA/TolQ/ExbB proton channel family protein [Archangium sp.]|nr:MotA/TolQ/ExbB proton channel family protein [Archangium sp.]MDP3157138.1 MotA/TolQ/ExbB proton channel family protein [Archangium sp.]MDP3575855.1 MotA/TolQ/ExbB proton channel family protein [Archangium sp.]